MDADLLKAVVPIAAAATAAVIARARVTSDVDRARADVDRLLDQYGKLAKFREFEKDTRRIAALVHSYVIELQILEEDLVDRAWRRAVLFGGITGVVTLVSGAYLMLRRGGAGWIVGAILLTTWALGVLVYSVREYNKLVSEADSKAEDLRASSHGIGSGRPEPELPGPGPTPA